MTTTETAPVTLYGAIEKLAAQWILDDDPGVSLSGARLRATLDAYPDNGVTEWGVYLGGGSYLSAPDKVEAQGWVADWSPSAPEKYLVSHVRTRASVTPWERAK